MLNLSVKFTRFLDVVVVITVTKPKKKQADPRVRLLELQGKASSLPSHLDYGVMLLV